MPIAIPLENVNVSTPSFLHPNSWFTDPAPITLNDVLQYSFSLCLDFFTCTEHIVEKLESHHRYDSTT